MWRNMRKCNGAEVVVAMVEKTAVTAAEVRKRKVALRESELLTSSIQLKTWRCLTPENSGDSACESVSFDVVPASCCSSNESSEENLKLESADLELQEENEVTVEFICATSSGDSADSKFRRKSASPNTVLVPSSQELNSTTVEATTPAEKIPSEAELEEFFTISEKTIQKKFIERYNYDIVKDQPLKGRYEWVQLKP